MRLKNTTLDVFVDVDDETAERLLKAGGYIKVEADEKPKTARKRAVKDQNKEA